MTEKFDSKFHKEYLRGEGPIEERQIAEIGAAVISVMSYEELLAEYRWYVKDPTAELPAEVMEQLRIHGKI